MKIVQFLAVWALYLVAVAIGACVLGPRDSWRLLRAQKPDSVDVEIEERRRG